MDTEPGYPSAPMGANDSGEARPAISVVVPFGGEADEAVALRAALESLKLEGRDEILVADNTVQAIASSVFSGTAVRVVSAAAEQSSYFARNAGADHARCEWLLFCDADCRPRPDLLDAFFAQPVSMECGLVAGQVVPVPGQPGLVAAYAAERGHLDQRRHVQADRGAFGATANLLVRRAAWQAVGGFQEGIRSAGDAEFCWRVQDAGWTFAFRPEAIVEHRHRETVGGLVRQAARYEAGRAWLDRRGGGTHRRDGIAGPLVGAAVAAVYRLGRGRRREAAFSVLDCVWMASAGLARLGANHAVRCVNSPPAAAGAIALVVLCDEFPALSETFVVNEVRALQAAGHRVRVEAGRRPARPERTVLAEVEVSYLEDAGIAERARDLAWLAARRPRACIADLRGQLRWRHEEQPWPLRHLAPAARRVEARGETHLHAHFASAAGLNAQRLGVLTRRPHSVTAHAYDIYKQPRNLPEKLARARFSTSGCAYTVADLQRIVGPPHDSRVHEIVMGVDVARFRRTRPYPGGRCVLAVGRLVEKKGFADLVDATAIMAADGAVDEVVIVGEGPLRGELEARIARLGISQTVRLTGWQDPDAVRGLLEEADVLAMPCVVAADGDRDSMPVVVKEALAMEVPVVATDEVGLPELVEPDWGRLVPPNDSGALAGALAEILALHADTRCAMGRAGRSRVAEAFELHDQTRRLAALISGASL